MRSAFASPSATVHMYVSMYVSAEKERARELFSLKRETTRLLLCQQCKG